MDGALGGVAHLQVTLLAHPPESVHPAAAVRF